MKLNVLKRVTTLLFVFALVACGTLALSGVFSARTEAEQIAPIEMQTAIEAVNKTYVSVTAPAAQPMFAAYGMNILSDTPTPFAGSTSGTVSTNQVSVKYTVDPKDMWWGNYLDINLNLDASIFSTATFDYRIDITFFSDYNYLYPITVKDKAYNYEIGSDKVDDRGVKSASIKMKAPSGAKSVKVQIFITGNDGAIGTPMDTENYSPILEFRYDK